jgi:hypothetical protein
MQRGRRTIVPDIGDKAAFAGQFVEAGSVRALVNEPALSENFQKVGFEIGHSFAITVSRLVAAAAGTCTGWS